MGAKCVVTSPFRKIDAARFARVAGWMNFDFACCFC